MYLHIGPSNTKMRFIIYGVSYITMTERRMSMGAEETRGGYGGYGGFGAFTSTGTILVLFILLVIISKTIFI